RTRDAHSAGRASRGAGRLHRRRGGASRFAALGGVLAGDARMVLTPPGFSRGRAPPERVPLGRSGGGERGEVSGEGPGAVGSARMKRGRGAPRARPPKRRAAGEVLRPPAAPPVGAPVAIGAPLTTFLGRASEIARLAEQFDAGDWLVT